MSVKQKLNILSQMRVDVPHLRSLEDSSLFDWKTHLADFVGQNPHILRGFSINNSPAFIGQQASTLQIAVSDASVWMPGQAAGSYLSVPTGTANEVLNSANVKVTGSFTEGAINYISLIFTRATDPSTVDLVNFWNVDSLIEFTKSVPLGLVLNYQFVINTTGFGTNAPIAIVNVNPGGTVGSITNAKTDLFRLGTGGAAPDPYHSFTYTIPNENPLTLSSAGGPDPFLGGDFEIGRFKEWMDAVMTRIKDLSGSAIWYANGSSAIFDVNLVDLWNDTTGSLVVSKGKFRHSSATPGQLVWTDLLTLKCILSEREYRIPAGNKTLLDSQVMYVELIRNDDFQPLNVFTFTGGTSTVSALNVITGIAVGDYIKFIGHPDNAWRKVVSFPTTSSIQLDANYPTNAVGKSLRSKGDYLITDVVVQYPNNIPANSDVYWLAKRDDLTPPATYSIVNVSRTTNVTTVQTLTSNTFVPGQTVEITGVPDTTFNGRFEIRTINSPTSFDVQNNGNDGVSVGGSVSTLAQMYLRWIGELNQGEERQVDGTISQDILDYIGAATDTQAIPEYVNYPTGSLPLPDFNQTGGENLTVRASSLTAMIADRWQDDQIMFDQGSVVFDPAANKISISNASISIVGSSGITTNVPINPMLNQVLNDNECLYVDISRSSNATLILSSNTVVSALTPAEQRLVLYRRSGNILYAKPSGVLDSNDSAVYEVTYHDPISTTLPTGVSVLIDGNAGVNGDKVLFSNLSSGNNEVYILSGVGSSIAWSPIPIFNGSITPLNGAYVKVLKGNAFANQFGQYIGTRTRFEFNDLIRQFNVAGDYFETTAPRFVSLIASTTGNIFTVPLVASNNFIVDYSIVRNAKKETGSVYVTHNGIIAEAATSDVSLGGASGVAFDASISGSNLLLNYTADGSGPNGSMNYSVKRWSDLSGGPAGLPVYSAVFTLPTAAPDTAFAMSDGSSIEVNCSAPTVVSGKTRLTLVWSYTPGIQPGTTESELEVLADGLHLPRFLSGTTTSGAYFKEIDPNTIEFYTDLSPTPITLEIRRKYSSFDYSNVNAQKLNAIYNIVVGSSSQVTAGAATHTSLQQAINDSVSGDRIYVLSTYALAENISINKTVIIDGQGLASQITGTLTFTNTGDFCVLQKLFITGNITFNAGSQANILNNSWQTLASTVTDSGTDNLYILLDV